ncbi:MAG TPA: YetF domain-containing protein [Anaeromyxobacter sp.]
MAHLLTPDASPLLLVVRAIVVYAFLLAALRIAGRRELAQMTSFDLVLLLIISNAVQNSINAGDDSLTGGLVSAATLLLLNWGVGFATWRWRRVETLVQGDPVRIVTDGKVHLGALRRELLTLAELRSALRKQGIMRISDCKQVVLEPDGTLSAVRSDIPQRPLEELAHPERLHPLGGGAGI